ncbi:hypothetical protein PPTG_07714 [Phytophthora nicotianae INRA-310]|uniref:HAT C-terminal dimerisation domain-containing protein n=1 Tax=Phytophthora nicotianae (strain INRA-310) TaxID=761204 RepID=W2QQD2_PHYN3|nr:hypothetical protein PPTG_07714 [Phytophthora nicotianae INRA-310]ETN14724.1 hypothetical protein PPTG_07714 [Phytophthora nicotianae INRA-310]
MLALYFHPAYIEVRKALPGNTAVTGIGNIGKFAKFSYKKFFGKDPGDIVREMHDWLTGSLIQYTLDDFEDSMLPAIPAFWRHVKMQFPNSRLADLAIAVLSVLVFTATCERYFSGIALIHTPLRNRMDSERRERLLVRENSYVAAYLSEQLKHRKLVLYLHKNWKCLSLCCAIAATIYDNPLASRDAVFGWMDACNEEEAIEGSVESTEVFDPSEFSQDVDAETQMPELPDFNDPRVPQEEINLVGERGKKATLDELFKLPGYPGEPSV